MPATATATDTVKFIFVTVGLVLGLGVAFAASFRTSIAMDWDTRHCEPGVVPLAGLFKPDKDPRTRAQFAADNWRTCQKEYVQAALRTATAAPQALAAAQADTVGVVESITRGLTDVFVDVWGFCYEAYSTFMEKIQGVAKMFHNQLIGIHAMVGRLNAAITSMVFGLISMIVAFVSSVQLIVIVVIIVVGILLIMQILLFFLLLPISSLILTISALVMSIAVVVATTVAAVTVGEMFQTGACFLAGTRVSMGGGRTKPIESLVLGERLGDGGRVTAIHRFWGCDPVYDIRGIHVTGDHLVWKYDVSGGNLIPVAEHPEARPLQPGLTERIFGPTPRELWCLTTTSRTIPVVSPLFGMDSSGNGIGGTLMFADWEEIPLGDMNGLRDWHAEVWRTLNGPAGPAVERPMVSALASEAGLSPECRVAVQTSVGAWWSGSGAAGGYRWTPVSEVRPGDYIATNASLTQFTAVVGSVRIQPDQVTLTMNLPAAEGQTQQRISAGTWLWQGAGVWAPALSHLRPLPTWGGASPAEWVHLYTAAGHFVLEGGWRVRDASDVGLEGLSPLVGRVVLKNGGPK